MKVAVVAFLVIVCGCASLPECQSAHPEEEVRSFFVDHVGVPECAVSVVRNGHVRTAGDSRAIFRIGSLTKCFIAETANRMHGRGIVDLDAPVTWYSRFPLAREYDDVTLRTLMEHRSGLPRDFLSPWNPVDWHRALWCGLFGSHIYGAFESEHSFVRFLNAEVSALERPHRCYSNVGFALFACALEDATGMSLDRLIREELLDPLGLYDTGFDLDEDMHSRLTPPCSGKLPWCVRRGCVVEANELGPVLRGMGGLKSSMSDVVRFFTVCGKDARRNFRRSTLPSGREIEYCFGMIYGGSSFVAFDVETGDFVVILLNVTSWPAEEDFVLADRLLRAR